MAKTRVIATKEIRRTKKAGVAATKDSAAVRPVYETISPGTVFFSEGDELEELRAAKAVREPEKGEKVGVDVESVTEETTNGDGGKKDKKSATKGTSQKPVPAPKGPKEGTNDSETDTSGLNPENGGEPEDENLV